MALSVRIRRAHDKMSPNHARPVTICPPPLNCGFQGMAGLGRETCLKCHTCVFLEESRLEKVRFGHPRQPANLEVQSNESE